MAKITTEELSSSLKEYLNGLGENLGKSENTKYSTENGIKEFSCKDGYVDNVAIEGETLVNLIRTNLPVEVWDNDRHVINLYDCYYIEGTYTLFNFSDKTIVFDIGYATEYKWSRTIVLDANKVITFNINNGERVLNVNGLFTGGWENNDTSKNEFRNSIVLLDGDHTTKSISYFGGLKSVGQGDKIEVLTYQGENLFDGELAKGKYEQSTGLATDGSHSRSKNRIRVDQGFYHINTDSTDPLIRILYYDLEDNFLYSELVPSNVYYVFEVKTDGYIRFHQSFLNLDGKVIITKKVDKKQISTTLRSLPNGIKDTIEKRGNKYVKVQRCEEITFNGEQDGWTGPYDVGTNAAKQVSLPYDEFILKPKVKGYVISSYLQYKKDERNPLQIELSTTDSGNFLMTRWNSDITSLELFNAKLKSNPLVVVYELETPIITELPNFNPQIYEDNTTLLLNTGVIQGECSFEITNSMGSELEVLKDKVSSLDDKGSSLDCDYAEDIELQFLNGWTKNTNGYHSAKVINGVVHINLLCSGGINTAGTSICLIKDQKFRPKTFIPFIIGTNAGAYVNGFVHPDGNIAIDTAPIPSNLWISISVSYPIL